MNNTILALSLSVLLVPLAPIGSAPEHNVKPAEGYIPDASTAAKVADAIPVPIHGDKQLNVERPLVAVLEGDRWHMRGVLREPLMAGGVAEVWISKQTGEIFRVTHGR
jgi:hypothetical protein